MIDSHRSTVNIELVEWRRRGLIERRSGRIIILDEAGLQELAQSLL
jgi:hypothetical protein